MSPPRIACPYCRSRIPRGAHACSFCAREVRLLLRARKRIRELEREVAELRSRAGAAAPEPSPAATGRRPLLPRLRSRRAIAVLWAYYLGSALSLRFVSPSPVWDLTILLGLGVVAGVLFARSDPNSNAWWLAVYGASLPLVVTLSYTLFGEVSLTEFVQELPDFFKMAALTAASVVLGGTAHASIHAHRFPPARFFAPASLGSVITRSEEGVDRVHRMATTTASLITMLGALYAFFFGGPP